MKSNNQKGNPNHDENGRFTSSSNASSGKLSPEEAKEISNERKFARLGFESDHEDLSDKDKLERMRKVIAWYADKRAKGNLSDDEKQDYDLMKQKFLELKDAIELKEWKSMGFYEIMVDPEEELELDLSNGSYEWGEDSYDVDLSDFVGKNDLKDFLASKLDAQENKKYLETGYIPRRIADDIKEDYADYIKEKHAGEIEEYLQDSVDYDKNPDSFYGVSRRM